jgi:hypothetical protein
MIAAAALEDGAAAVLIWWCSMALCSMSGTHLFMAWTCSPCEDALFYLEAPCSFAWFRLVMPPIPFEEDEGRHNQDDENTC